MWENLADPIITGRGGQPKLFAEIPERRQVDGACHCEASLMEFRFLDLAVSEFIDPAIDTTPEPQMEGTLMLKYVPGKGRVSVHRATWRDLPTMYHVINALSDLPVLSSRGASVTITRGGKSNLDQRILKLTVYRRCPDTVLCIVYCGRTGFVRSFEYGDRHAKGAVDVASCLLCPASHR
jgi:hypothetical protein